MVGPTALLALWLVAATPTATPASATPREESAVIHCSAQDGSPFREESPGGPESPKRLPKSKYDPSYDADQTPPAPAEGIPGLKPAEEEPAEAVVGDSPSEAPCHDGPACVEPRNGWLRGICYEGWLDQGATVNVVSPRNRANGPVTFNDRSNDYQLNQFYLRLKRDVEQDSDAWDVGGRVDLLYGADQAFVVARGLETFDDFAPKWNAQRYGLAMPQVYMELYAPWGDGLTMKLGHFYTIMGYETVPAPDNFFYSHAYTHQYGEPFTHTGFLAATKLEDFTIQAGMVRAWDTWENTIDDPGFLGGVSWTSPSERTNIAFAVDVGPQQNEPLPTTSTRTAYSLVMQQKLGECWQYVLQHDLGTQPGAGVGGATANWYGVNNYLFRTLNDAWKAGLRCEWFHDGHGARVPGVLQTADYFEVSTGLNWTPGRRVIVRPELRYDWTGTEGVRPYGDGARSWQLLVDCDVIVRF